MPSPHPYDRLAILKRTLEPVAPNGRFGSILAFQDGLQAPH